jgi:amino acid adenylation domain-containing protein
MHDPVTGMPSETQSSETPETRVSPAAPPTGGLVLSDEYQESSPNPSGNYPRELCVHQLLEAQAQRTPQAPAVEFNGLSLTYAELDSRANQLAHLLWKLGLKREVLIGVCVDRSLEMVVALLGILKAGSAYVPLDPAYPADRIKYILDDARVEILITQESLLNSLASSISQKTICLDPSWKALLHESTERVAVEVAPENLSYVIYTSGSTGKPKGVQVEHRGVVNLLCSMRQEPGMGSQDVLVAVTTISFDIAGLEIYLPLLVGANLVIASREATYDGRLLVDLLKKSGATVMQGTPATWRLLLDSGWQGDPKLKVLVGGEALSPELARELASRCGSVWNMYGPTETTIWSAVHAVDGRDKRLVPIGRPIANTTFYILDHNRQPVPAGVEGELYIGGQGVARGYFQRPELTADRFVPDPFSCTAGARMYRTGDLVRYRRDGNVEFLGRTDHQVKIRGFRIELGEIEAVLEQHPGILRAVVIPREDTPGRKSLVAYVVPKFERVCTAQDLRSHVLKQLPDYMVPSAFLQLARLPLTPNGKLNRAALPKPERADLDSNQNYVAPRDAVERKLVKLWEEALGVSPIGVRTSFFDLGGRSLLAARLFMKMSRAFGKDLALATLFRAPTIEQLATELRLNGAAVYSTVIAIQPSGSKPPFFCVHGGAGGTLFLHRLAREMGADRPFYGLEPEGLDGRRFQHSTLEQMAAHYIWEVRKVQPEGPYYIGGYCFGGLVAFEMAQQLRARGQQAEVVGMFNAPLRFNRPATISTRDVNTMSYSRPAKMRLASLLRSPWRAVRWRIVSLAQPFRAKLHMAACRLFLKLGIAIPQPMRTTYVARMIGRIERNYIPKRYPGSLILFRGRGLYENDPNMGWDELADRITNFEIGDRDSVSRREIMNEPLVGELAVYLKACLDKPDYNRSVEHRLA